MPDHAVKILLANAIHTAFIKYPEGDGSPNLDYEWHLTKARILPRPSFWIWPPTYQIIKKSAA